MKVLITSVPSMAEQELRQFLKDKKSVAGNPIALHAAKQLQRGTVLYSRLFFGSDGRPQRWRVNGKVKTWKRDPTRVRVPLKHGLWSYAHLDEFTLETLSLDELEQ